MKKVFAIFVAVFAATVLFAEKDPFVGFYKGVVTEGQGYPLSVEPNVYAEVYRSGDTYRLKVISKPFARSTPALVIENLKASGDKIILKNEPAIAREAVAINLSGEITADEISLSGKNKKKTTTLINLKKYNYVSPTLNMRPPKGSIVLFDGKNMDEWTHENGEPCSWDLKDGTMISRLLVVGKKKMDGTIQSKKKFGKSRLHVEFKIPSEFNQPQEVRGNSGVYFGNYEVQVLDSFGTAGDFGDCGSIYRVSAPKVNASLEPEAWQTFDIEFTPAVFDAEGKCISDPIMTVYHNGILVQKAEKIEYLTNIQKRGRPHDNQPCSILLQDHSHPVSFRNIWIENL